ncbi:MAG: MBL fold metallo-hydrolase [Deltaproteobacteria bacterium]|nr:MBL fold metallo-hydrolase [Deltaproteobacteria bacterium]
MKRWEDIYFYPSKTTLEFTGEINSNSVLIKGEKHILIDPGVSRRWEGLKGAIAADGLDPMDIDLIFCTHCHPDHADAAVGAAREFKADLLMSMAELDFLTSGGDRFYLRTPSGEEIPKGVIEVPDASLFKRGYPGPLFHGGREYRLYLTPGHTPGGCCFHWPDRGFLATGDVYFKGTIGSIELFGSNPGDMYRSVNLLGGLRDVEKVVCGHGPEIDGRDDVIRNYDLLFAEIAQKKAKGIL